MEDSARNDLLVALRKLSKTGEFTLASGAKSDWYLDCRPAIATYHSLRIASDHLVETAQLLELPYLAGPATAAIGLMAAAISSDDDAPDRFAWTRKDAKDHGMGQKVEGADLGKSPKVLLVDDVLTSGGSLLKCAATLKAKYPNITFVGAWVIVDREQGGKESLREHGIDVHSLFTRSDILAEA